MSERSLHKKAAFWHIKLISASLNLIFLYILTVVIIMEKRAIFSFLISAVLSAALVLRIAVINDSLYSDASVSQSTRRIEVASSRGMIYDRNMLPMVNRKEKTVLAVDPVSEAMLCLKKELSEEEYAVAQENALNGMPFLIECENYSGNCDSIVPLTVYERYSVSDTAAHIVGYLDSDGNGTSGIEKSFNDLLNEYSGTLSIKYSADSSGLMLRGDSFEVISDGYASEGGIVLTVDREIQRVCEEVAERNELEKGAVVVLDVKTSEILALVSTPAFDRDDMAASLTDDNSPFLNRALNAYSVGSVFKPIVALAALEVGISADTVFDCKGYVTVNGQRFNCHKKDGHGMINMSEAISVSCNSYFIHLGQKIGSAKILETASNLGFGTEIALCDYMNSAAGNLPDAQSVDSMPALANLSFGQGTLLATPLQIAAAYCAFANGGYYREPYILKEMADENGNITAHYKNEVNNKVIPDSICEKICEMLEKTVSEGSGKLAKPMCYDAAGKTATAETGWIENGSQIYHTWFAGYYPADTPEYVIVVFKEDGDSSSTDCAPVFRDIADGITSLYGG